MDKKTVDFIFSFKVKEGKEQRYEEVIAEQIAISKTEEGTLQYDIFKHEDGTYCQHEQYADEQALITHTMNTATQLQEWMTIVEMKQIIALGPLSNQVIEQYQLEEHYLPFQSANK